MGLAAVPFGTAQAKDYEIKVTQEYTCDPNDPKSEKDGAMHFKISVSKDGGEPEVAEIVWPVDKECPNPIRIPGYFIQAMLQQPRDRWFFDIYPSRRSFMDVKKVDERSVASLINKKIWAEFYDPKKFSDEEIKKVFEGSNVPVKDSYDSDGNDGYMPLFKAFHIRKILEAFRRGVLGTEKAEELYFTGLEGAWEGDSLHKERYSNFKKEYSHRSLDFFYGEPKGSFYRRVSLGSGERRRECVCVHYIYGIFLFTLIKDPNRSFSDSVYKLIIEIYGCKGEKCSNGRVDSDTYIWLSSDVPTRCCGIFRGLYSDNEMGGEEFGEQKFVDILDVFEEDISYGQCLRGTFFAFPSSVSRVKRLSTGTGRRQFIVHVGNDEGISEVMLENCHPLKHGKDGYWSKMVKDSRFFEKDRKVKNLKDLRTHMEELSTVINKGK